MDHLLAINCYLRTNWQLWVIQQISKQPIFIFTFGHTTILWKITPQQKPIIYRISSFPSSFFFTISPSFLFFSILHRSFNQLNLPKFLDFSTCVAVTPVIAITFFKLSILTYFLSKYELLMNMHVGRPHYHFKLDSLKNLKRCKRCPNTNRYKIHRRQ